MGRGNRQQLTKPDEVNEDTVEVMEAVFEERGMPEKEAEERARNAAKRIRRSKSEGKRIDAKPASKRAGTAAGATKSSARKTKPASKRTSKTARPSSAKPRKPLPAAKAARKNLSLPVMENDYSPAEPHREKKK
jgi:hypothetical protein